MSEKTQRRLAAVMAADVVGYSRLMGEDEAGTLMALREFRTSLFEPSVAEHRGEVAKNMGDGWLVTFDSAVDAVTCALDVQEKLHSQEQIKLRMGLHIGDVTRADADIYGDGINIAARLQELAEPGAIVLSDVARRSIDNKLAASFTDLGRQDLKNIAEPVAAYGWGMTKVVSDPEVSALPYKPSIAVLPFVNMSGDTEQEYFADGIAEDIITLLSRSHQFFVTSRNSSFVYKGKLVEVKQAARELGVQYVLEGSVRRAGNRVRITAQLIDAVGDHHIWAERYDRDLDDIFAVQDEITECIAVAVAPELDLSEMARAQRKNIPELGAWELVARARWHMYKITTAHNAEAQDLASRALQIDPGFSQAYSVLASTYILDAVYGWQRPQARRRALALDMARKAVELDKYNEATHAALGVAYYVSRRSDEAIRSFETALSINPDYSEAIGQMGVTMINCGRGEEGCELIDKALRLNPKAPTRAVYFANVGLHYYLGKRYEEALDWVEKALHENPTLPFAQRILTSSHGMLANKTQAHAAYLQLDKLLPGVTIADSLQAPIAFREDLEHYVEGLRRAGMPED